MAHTSDMDDGKTPWKTRQNCTVQRYTAMKILEYCGLDLDLKKSLEGVLKVTWTLKKIKSDTTIHFFLYEANEMQRG